MTIQEKKVSYSELVDNYLGNIVLSNELFDYLLKDSFNNGNEFEVVNGDLNEYYNRCGNLITREQFDECEYYGTDPEMREKEFYQYYLIDSYTYKELQALTDETVVYFPDADAAFWCIDHWGTSWDYVYTTIELKDYTDELKRELKK